MSNAAVIAIAIAVVVLLAAIVFVTTARRSDVRGAGALSSETRRRDDAARRARADAEAGTSRADAPSPPGAGVAVLTADEAERAGDEARHPTPVLAPPAAPVPWVPPDPEAIGVSRRQFFNRSTVILMGTSIGAFSAAGFVAFLWPTATGGFGQVVGVGNIDDIKEGARGNSGFFYAPSARTWFTEYPAEALTDAETVYDEPIFAGMRDWGLVALYQKCPHLGCRVPECAVESLVRVPVPRLAVQPGRGEEGRPGTSGHGPLQHQRRRRWQRQRRHRHGLRRPSDRHEHHGSRSRGPTLHRRRRVGVVFRPHSFARCARSLRSGELVSGLRPLLRIFAGRPAEPDRPAGGGLRLEPRPRRPRRSSPCEVGPL